jgi:hypothetical protein
LEVIKMCEDDVDELDGGISVIVVAVLLED